MKYYPFINEKPKQKNEPIPLYIEIEDYQLPIKEKEDKSKIVIIELFFNE